MLYDGSSRIGGSRTSCSRARPVARQREPREVPVDGDSAPRRGDAQARGVGTSHGEDRWGREHVRVVAAAGRHQHGRAERRSHEACCGWRRSSRRLGHGQRAQRTSTSATVAWSKSPKMGVCPQPAYRPVADDSAFIGAGQRHLRRAASSASSGWPATADALKQIRARSGDRDPDIRCRSSTVSRRSVTS
jgi:hypothetical protein